MAGLGRKVFTAGDVLTASDVQSYLMDQTVMNFAGTAARSSAIATPTDGMVTYNQTNNSLEAYNGAEWINTSGLQLVKKQTIGTGVSSVTVTSAFSATYDNYKIIVTGGSNSSGTTNVLTTLGGSTTGYYYNLIYTNYNTTTPLALSASNTSSWAYSAASTGTNGWQMNLDVFAPFLAARTGMCGNYINLGPALSAGPIGGFIENTNSHTAFTLTPSAGTLTGGTIYVYGYGI